MFLVGLVAVLLASMFKAPIGRLLANSGWNETLSQGSDT